jgi:hypothetical protein
MPVMRCLDFLVMCVVVAAVVRGESSDCCAIRLMRIAKSGGTEDMRCHVCYPTEKLLNSTHWKCVGGSLVVLSDHGLKQEDVYGRSPCEERRRKRNTSEHRMIYV